jgi:PAS domain-containing protein
MQEPTSPQERMDLVLQAIQEVVGIERAVVWLPSADGAALETTSWIGFDEAIGARSGSRSTAAPRCSRLAYRQGREMVVDPARAVPAELRAAPHLAQPEAAALAGAGGAAARVAGPHGGRAGGRQPLQPAAPRRQAARAAPLRRERGVAIDSALLYEAVQAELVERRAAEAELRRSEEKYRTILETIQDAYFEADAGGVLRLANPAFVAGLGAASLDEVLGKSYRRFVDPPTCAS